MRREASDKNAVRAHVGRIRDTLDDPRLQDVMQRAAAQVAGDELPREKISALLSPDITLADPGKRRSQREIPSCATGTNGPAPHKNLRRTEPADPGASGDRGVCASAHK
jgi:hypothetical protein